MGHGMDLDYVFSKANVALEHFKHPKEVIWKELKDEKNKAKKSNSRTNKVSGQKDSSKQEKGC